MQAIQITAKMSLCYRSLRLIYEFNLQSNISSIALLRIAIKLFLSIRYKEQLQMFMRSTEFTNDYIGQMNIIVMLCFKICSTLIRAERFP